MDARIHTQQSVHLHIPTERPCPISVRRLKWENCLKYGHPVRTKVGDFGLEGNGHQIVGISKPAADTSTKAEAQIEIEQMPWVSVIILMPNYEQSAPPIKVSWNVSIAHPYLSLSLIHESIYISLSLSHSPAPSTVLHLGMAISDFFFGPCSSHGTCSILTI